MVSLIPAILEQIHTRINKTKQKQTRRWTKEWEGEELEEANLLLRVQLQRSSSSGLTLKEFFPRKPKYIPLPVSSAPREMTSAHS